MKIAFSLLMCLAAATIAPATAATKVATYEQAQAQLTSDGYILFIYGKGWDKLAEKQLTALYNNPAIIQAAGSATLIMVPLPESPDEAEKAALASILGELKLPHDHSKHSFPALVMYDQKGRQYGIICGPSIIHSTAGQVANIISQKRAALGKQERLLSLAEQANGGIKAHMLYQASRIEGIERPDKIEQMLKDADPEDSTGCLAALRFYNNPVGDAIKDMPLADALKEMDKAINNPLHTVQQKQNACAFTIGLIRRKVGMGGSHLIRQYAEQMKALNPSSVLGRSADVVIRDWTQGLQYVRGWSPYTLPMQGTPTEIQGRLPIAEPGTYNVRFTPSGGRNHAKVACVALYDGGRLVDIDKRYFTLSTPASYFIKVTEPVKEPHLFVTFDNAETDRDTHGRITITRQ